MGERRNCGVTGGGSASSLLDLYRKTMTHTIEYKGYAYVRFRIYRIHFVVRIVKFHCEISPRISNFGYIGYIFCIFIMAYSDRIDSNFEFGYLTYKNIWKLPARKSSVLGRGWGGLNPHEKFLCREFFELWRGFLSGKTASFVVKNRGACESCVMTYYCRDEVLADFGRHSRIMRGGRIEGDCSYLTKTQSH